ncbi:hypothetical protein, partial [Sphaerisporangium rhizosphaerae]
MSPTPTTPPSTPADPARTPPERREGIPEPGGRPPHRETTRDDMAGVPSEGPGAETVRPGGAMAGGWIGYAAAVWAAAYGVVALSWTMTGRGYPFEGPSSAGAAPVLRGVSAEVAAPVFAGVLLATAVAALAMAGRHAVRPRGVPRAALLTFGYAVALSLMVLVPGADLLALTGYAPMLILGAPFGRPSGIDYSTVFDWSLLNQAWSLAGGFLVGAAVLSWQRRGRGACGRCGRDDAVAAAASARTA